MGRCQGFFPFGGDLFDILTALDNLISPVINAK